MFLLKKIGWMLCFLCLVTTSFADPNDDTGQLDPVAVDKQSQDAIGNMLLQSISLIGIPYRWGGNTPEEGMDCSGFIRYIFKKSMGITLPRTAAEMATVGKRVSLDELEPGDLLFFTIHHNRIDHVGMYIGDNKFIQSPHTGDTIKVTELTSPWRAHITGAKRIVQEDENDNGSTTVESYQEVRDEALPSRAGYSRRPTAHGHGHKHGSTAYHKHARKKKHR